MSANRRPPNCRSTSTNSTKTKAKQKSYGGAVRCAPDSTIFVDCHLTKEQLLRLSQAINNYLADSSEQ